MSFLKHEPPKPKPMSAPIFSQMAHMEFMLLFRCASIALATSFESPDDQTLIVVILNRGTHAAYTSTRVAVALRLDIVFVEPMVTLSGLRRSLIAPPSARNSGFDRISNLTPGL
jgi:hypothetical protein